MTLFALSTIPPSLVTVHAEDPPATDLERVTDCTDQPDACLVDAFFDDTLPSTSWNHTFWVGPPEPVLPTQSTAQDTFVLGLDATTPTAALNIDGTRYLIHGGDITPRLDHGQGAEWVHLGFTYADGAWHLYQDGQIVAARTDVTGAVQAGLANVTIGQTDHPESAALQGGIGDIRTYARALDPTEIQQAMENGQSTIIGGLTDILSGASHIWRFDEGQGTIAEDAVGNADALITATTTWTDQHNGNALSIDQATDTIALPTSTAIPTTDGLTVLGWFRIAEPTSQPTALVAQWGTQYELRFIDAGIRPPGPGKGDHHVETDLDADWNTFVICRLYTAPDEPRPCPEAIAPAAFHYGLDLSWSPTERSRLLSEWRIATPSDDVHDEFVRVHGPDATLLHKTTRPHSEGTGAHPEGHLDLVCAIVPFLPFNTLVTNNTIPPSYDVQPCPDARLASSPPKEVPPAGDLLWCDDPITQHIELIHRSRILEEALWTATASCAAITGGEVTMGWDTFLRDRTGDLAQAATLYAQATNDTARAQAEADYDAILRGAISDHLGIWWRDLGMPMNVTYAGDPPQVVNASDFHLVDAAPDNVDIVGFRVLDAEEGWTNVTARPPVAFTPTRLALEVVFTSLTGESLLRDLVLLLQDQAPKPHGDTSLVRFNETVAGSFQARDGDNRDHLANLSIDSYRPSSFPLVNVSNEGGLIGSGIFETGFHLPVDDTNFTACMQQVWTANVTGIASNVASDELAIEPTNLTRCLDYTGLPLIDLKLWQDITITLEIREGLGLNLLTTIIGDPLDHLINSTAPLADYDLDDALGGELPIDDIDPFELGAIRLVLELPPLTPAAKANVLTLLLEHLSPVVDTFAVEMEHVQLTPWLDREIKWAVSTYDTLVIVPIGTLPPATLGMAVEDKLMTIGGLAAHPLVLTIGSGSLADGIHPLSRLGPTTALTPKPDFIAPSPAGTTIGAVMNVLPFVEALSLRGIGHPQVVRAILSGFATPVLSGDGRVATFYEQGYGALDLATFLELPSLDDALLQISEILDQTVQQVRDNVTTALNITEAELDASTTAQVLGALAIPKALLDSAVSFTLLNLTIDSPAIPATLAIDHGVVNHALPGAALAVPIDVDPVINATSDTLVTLLKEIGYTGTVLDDLVEGIAENLRIRAEAGQDVTINVTHYYLFDALDDDFLYTVYRKVLHQTLTDHADQLAVAYDDFNSTKTTSAYDRLDDWLLDEHHLVPEWNDTVTMDVRVNRACIEIPAVAIIEFAFKTVRVLHDQAGLIHGALQASGVNPMKSVNGLEHPTSKASEFGGDQVRQVLCAGDIIAYLNAIKGVAQELRALKQVPHGQWNETEQRLARWDRTVLGGQLLDAMNETGIDPRDVTQNETTQVLDLTIEALNGAIALIEQKLGLLRIPHIVARNITMPSLETNTSRTDDVARHPLGPYVGLGMMTSRNITLYNPFTGEALVDRDVTIPVPAFLWNNPTLIWNEVYRDESPLVNTSIGLDFPRLRIFNNTTVNATTTVDGILLNLSATVDDVVEEERIQLVDLQLTVEALIEAARELIANTTGPHGIDIWIEQLELLDLDLLQRLESLQQLLNASAPGGLMTFDGPAVENAVQRPYSKLYVQQMQTNETGHATIPNLFPGSWERTIPYPYPEMAELRFERDYRNPGSGAYDGWLRDIDYEVHRTIHDTLGAVDPHPSVQPEHSNDPPSPGVPVPEENRTMFWQDHTEKVGHPTPFFHQFMAKSAGPDVLGLSCAAIHNFDQLTESGWMVPGCGAPLVVGHRLVNLTGLLHMLGCLVDQFGIVPGDGGALDPLCERIQSTRDEIQRACDLGDHLSCLELNRTLPVLNATIALLVALPSLLPLQSLLVPWPHSVKRQVLEDPANFSYTRDDLIERAKPLNPNNTSAEIGIAVDAFLANLSAELDGVYQVTPPPKIRHHAEVYPTALLTHTTDKVAGLDWWHSDILGAPIEVQANATKIRHLYDGVFGMVTNETDAALLADYYAEVTAADNATLLAAYNAGVAINNSRRVDRLEAGWVPHGIMTEGLAPFRLAPKNLTTTAQEMCADAQRNHSGLPASMVDCERFQVPVAGNVSVGLAGMNVDVAMLANELVRHARNNTTDPMDAFTEAVGMAHAGYGWRFERTREAFVADARAEALDNEVQVYTPQPLVLHYAMPIGVNEWVGAHIQGELVTQNTFAIIIHTTYDDVAASVHAALDEISLVAPDNPLRRLGDVLGALDTILLERDKGRTNMKVDIVGFPVRQSLSSPDELQCPHCDEGSQARGTTAFRAHEYHDYGRSFQFNTKGQEENTAFGPTYMHSLMLVFPSITGDNTPGQPSQAPGANEKLIVRNWTMLASTYLGLSQSGPNEPEAFLHQFGVKMPIRYRANLEDYTFLYAVPDQRPNHLRAENEPWGLNVTANNLLHPLDPERFDYHTEDFGYIEGLHNKDLQGFCPDEALPGFRTPPPGEYRYYANMGPHANGGGMYYETVGGHDPQLCLKNKITGTEADRQVTGGWDDADENGTSARRWGYTRPAKGFHDAAAYVTNVPGVGEESFSGLAGIRAFPFSCALCAIETKLIGGTPATGNAILENTQNGLVRLGPRSAGYDLGLGGALSVLDGVGTIYATKNNLDDPIDHLLVGLLGSRLNGHINVPSLIDSFLPGAQHGLEESRKDRALHNWAVVDIDMAHRLTRQPWNPTWEYHMRDNTTPELSDDEWIPPGVPFFGAHALDRDNKSDDPYAVTLAWENVLSIKGKGDKSHYDLNINNNAKAIMANGQTGTGWALDVFVVDSTSLADSNRDLVTEGLSAGNRGTVVATAYLLGGLTTASSDCSEIPLYDLIRAYMRCEGVSAVAVLTMEAGASSSSTQCLKVTRNFLEEFGKAGTREIITHSDTPWAVIDPVEDVLYSTIFGGSYTGEDAAEDLATPIEDAVHTAEQVTMPIIAWAAATALCVIGTTGVGAMPGAAFQQSALDGLQALITSTNITLPNNTTIHQPMSWPYHERSWSAQNITRLLTPGVHDDGLPLDPGAMVRAVYADVGLPSANGWWPLDGLTNVSLIANGFDANLTLARLSVNETTDTGEPLASVVLVDTNRTGVWPAVLNTTNGHDYVFWAQVQDEHGNADQRERLLRIDTDPPLITERPSAPFPPLDTVWRDASGELSWNATDPRSGIEHANLTWTRTGANESIRLEGAEAGTHVAYDVSIPLTGTNGTATNVWLNVTDLAGNTNSSTITVREDHQDPFLFDLPDAPDYLNADFDITWAVYDNHSGLQDIVYDQDGGAPGADATVDGDGANGREGSFTAKVAGTEGSLLASTVSATDVVGRTRTWQHTFTEDPTDPWIQATPSHPTYVTQDLDMTWTAIDNTSGIERGRLEESVDGTGFQPLAELPSAEPGESVVQPYMYAVAGRDGSQVALRLFEEDRAGNHAEWTGTFTVDTTPPTIEIVYNRSAEAPPWHHATVNVTLEANDATSGIATFEYRLDDGSYADVDGPINITEAGLHELFVRATDHAGHETTAYEVIGLDATAPTLDITTPVPGSKVNASSVTVPFSVTDQDAHVETVTLSLHNETGTVAVIDATETVSNDTYREGWEAGSLASWQKTGGNHASVVTDPRPNSDYMLKIGNNYVAGHNPPAGAEYSTAIDLSGPGKIRFDWRWTTEQQVSDHGAFVQFEADAGPAHRYYLVTTGDYLLPANTSTLVVHDLSEDAPAEGVWTTFTHDVFDDIGFDEPTQIQRIWIAQEHTRVFAGTKPHLFVDDLRVTTRGPGTLSGSADPPIWHSGTYWVEAEAIDDAGRVTTTGSALDAFQAWITPVPSLAILGVVAGATYLDGIPVATGATATAVIGSGLDAMLAGSGPAGTWFQATHANGTTDATSGTSATFPSLLDARALDAGTYVASLFAKTPAKSWNETALAWHVPAEVLVAQGFEAAIPAWTFDDPGNEEDRAAIINITTDSGTHATSGDGALFVRANSTTTSAANATVAWDLDGGGHRVTARIIMPYDASALSASRSEWFDVLTPLNGTDPILRLGFLDAGEGLDVLYDDEGTPSVAYNVTDLAALEEHLLELRLYDEEVDVVLDGVSLGRYGRLATGILDGARFGALSGPGDAGSVFVDELTVHQARLRARTVVAETLAAPDDWNGVDGVNASADTDAVHGPVLHVESTATSPHAVWRTIDAADHDATWDFHVRVGSSTAAESAPDTHMRLFDVVNGTNVSRLGIWLMNGMTLGVTDGTDRVLSTTTLDAGTWARVRLTVTPAGYRVWVDDAAVTTADGAHVFAGDVSGAVGVRVGDGNGSMDLAVFRAYTGARIDGTTWETDLDGWRLAEAGSAITSRLDVDGPAGPGFDAVSGDHVLRVASSTTSSDAASLARDLVLPAQYELSSWLHLDDDAAVVYDGMSALSVQDAAGAELFALRLRDAATEVALDAVNGTGVVDSGLALGDSSWYEVRVTVDETAGTWRLNVAGVGTATGVLGDAGPGRQVVLGDLVADLATGTPSGGGTAYWDDVLVRRANAAPLPAFVTPASSIVREDFTLSGTVTDSAWDPLVNVSLKIGTEDWIELDRLRHWAHEVDTSNWTDDTHYWVHVRADDGADHGTTSRIICYKQGSGGCSTNNPPIGISDP